MKKGRAVKGDRAECVECGRWVGYWPDKGDYHVAYLMPHRTREFSPYRLTAPPWCEGRLYVG